MSNVVHRLFESRRVIFGDDPASLRVLSLWLYAAVGPLFVAILFLESHADARVPATLAVAGLILLGAGLLLAFRPPTNPVWMVTAGVVPTASCGIAFWATGADGLAFAAIMAAPVAWAAVLFDLPVVVATLVIAVVAHVVTLPDPGGPMQAAANTLVFATVTSLIAVVGYNKSMGLRRAREEAALGAARIAAILDAIPDTIARIDPDGQFLEVRSTPGSSLPVAPEALVGRNLFDFLPPDVHERARRASERALATGRPETVAYQVAYPERTVNIEARIVRSAPGELVVVRQDVTDRIESAREHRFLAALVDNMPEAVVTVDPAGRVTSWSPGAERMYGWSAEEALGSLMGMLVIPDMDEPRFAGFMATLASGPTRRTGERVAKGGRRLIVETSFTPLRDDRGELSAVLGVSRDITATAQAHDLALSQARLEGLDKGMNEIELIVDFDGRVVHANDRALEAYGYGREEIERLTVLDIRDPSTHAAIADQMAAADDDGIRFTTLHRRRDGSTFPAQVSARGFEVGGRRYLHSLVLDLTDRQRMEADQKRILDELLEALASVRTLSGLLPICMYCKKIRNDQGYWDRIEKYVSEHSDARFSHGMCPDCYERYVEPQLQDGG